MSTRSSRLSVARNTRNVLAKRNNGSSNTSSASKTKKKKTIGQDEVLQVVQNHKNVKSEKIEDQGNEKIDVWYNGTVNDVHDMENDFDIDDVQFNHSDDEEGTSTGPVKPFFPVRKLANSFSLTADLAGQKPNDPIESLKNHIDAGDVINIGREIQKGIGSGTLTEIQLLEFTQTVPPPQISITSFVNQIEKSDLEDVKSIMVAQHFMNKMKSNVQKSITKFEAKLNSLSSNLDETRHVITKDIEQLMASHIIPAAAPFPTINLAPFFTLKNFAGDKVVNQMTNLYSAIFKKYLPNEYDIWVYSYRPVCAKATDRHFKPLPDTIVEGLQDFGLDVLGAYLPLHLLCGPITETDPFAIALGDDSTAKIEYRRSIRVDMCKLIDSAIGFSLQSLRNNHFDLDLSKLVYCPERKNCLSHYRWDDVKVYRHTRRCAGLDVEAYSIEDVMRACERSTTEPIYDGPQRQNDNGNDVDDTG